MQHKTLTNNINQRSAPHLDHIAHQLNINLNNDFTDGVPNLQINYHKNTNRLIDYRQRLILFKTNHKILLTIHPYLIDSLTNDHKVISQIRLFIKNNEIHLTITNDTLNDEQLPKVFQIIIQIIFQSLVINLQLTATIKMDTHKNQSIRPFFQPLNLRKYHRTQLWLQIHQNNVTREPPTLLLLINNELLIDETCHRIEINDEGLDIPPQFKHIVFGDHDVYQLTQK